MAAAGAGGCDPDAPAAGCPCVPEQGARRGACDAGFQCAEGDPAQQLARQLRVAPPLNSSTRCPLQPHATSQLQ